MEPSVDIIGRLREVLPLATTAAVVAIVLAMGHTWKRLRERRDGGGAALTPQVLMLVLTATGAVALVVALPVSDAVRAQLLALLGLVFTGVVAFASTTFAANVMAGLMLRAVRNFTLGDWIRVRDFFGRVTERGMFHVEIQTEDGDLATLPNFFIATNPVTVVRESGTIVSASVSLGYEYSHAEIEPLLLRAAEQSGLGDPFVQVLDLTDFSVRYRIAGFLSEVKQLLTARSKLRASVLDVLHAADVEIVSPSYMNQRQLAGLRRAIPVRHPPSEAPDTRTPLEEIVFDKAEESASLEELRKEQSRLRAERDELLGAVRSASKEDRPAIESTVRKIERGLAAMEDEIEASESGTGKPERDRS